MAKKKQKFTRPRQNILIAGIVVLALAVGFGAVRLQHNREVTADKARFAQAGNDVEKVAEQIIATVGQPQDRKDGGKCRYASEKFGKGPLTCEVYSYLAYGVNGPGQVNAIAQKAASVDSLKGSPWQFQAITEQPYQFLDGASPSGTFVNVRKLFDTETRSIVYQDKLVDMGCAVNFLYFNSVAHLSGYPDFNISQPQILLIDINCVNQAKAEHFRIED